MYIQIRIIQIHASIQQRRFYTPTRVLPWSQHVKWSRSSCQVQISRPSAGLDGGSGIRLGGILIRVPCITLVKRPFAGLKEHRSNAHSSPLHQSCKTLRQICIYIYISLYYHLFLDSILMSTKIQAEKTWTSLYGSMWVLLWDIQGSQHTIQELFFWTVIVTT